MTSAAADAEHMRRAMALAAAQVGRTGDNPAVGCVIVSGGTVVGESATADCGRPHAEEQALDQAGSAARGATAYVTLEPCAARSGGGPSCAERLATAGVARVVVACADPSTFAAGQGAERMRAAGITFEIGLLGAEAQVLYASYRPAGPSRP